MKGISEHIKTLLTVFFVLLLGILSALRLMKIQVVGDNEIISSAPDNPGAFTYSEPITATRGEIVDYFGAPIISNKTGYSAVLKKLSSLMTIRTATVFLSKLIIFSNLMAIL